MTLRPGWHTARFCYAHPHGWHPVIGITRGCWGIYVRTYEVVRAGEDARPYNLASLTHLPIGYRFALFTDPADAAEGAEIADRLCDWAALTLPDCGSPAWKVSAQRVFDAWRDFHLFKTDLLNVEDRRPIYARDLAARPDHMQAGRLQ
jgi:hypothetical protein